MGNVRQHLFLAAAFGEGQGNAQKKTYHSNDSDLHFHRRRAKLYPNT